MHMVMVSTAQIIPYYLCVCIILFIAAVFLSKRENASSVYSKAMSHSLFFCCGQEGHEATDYLVKNSQVFNGMK